MQSTSSTVQDTDVSATSTSTAVESKITAGVENSAGSKKSYVYGGKQKWSDFHNRLFRRSLAVYVLVIAFVWLLYSIPIIAYFSTNKMVSCSLIS